MFSQKGLEEIETPSLVEGPAFETLLEPFATHMKWDNKVKALFLPTSPEISIKKLIAMGFYNVFEIKRCFRNGELGPFHEPEFHMLEWYRAGENLELLVEDIEYLFVQMQAHGWLEGECNEVQKISYAELFRWYLDFQLSPQTKVDELIELANRWGLKTEGNEDPSLICDWLFVAKIEPQLDPQQPLIIHSYPPWVQTLAKVNAQGWADRFELYFRGMEIANAFNELLDFEEHERRWHKIMAMRQKQNLAPLARDEQFFQAVKKGLPPTVGIALGLERLFMACQNLSEIADFQIFAKAKNFAREFSPGQP